MHPGAFFFSDIKLGKCQAGGVQFPPLFCSFFRNLQISVNALSISTRKGTKQCAFLEFKQIPVRVTFNFGSDLSLWHTIKAITNRDTILFYSVDRQVKTAIHTESPSWNSDHKRLIAIQKFAIPSFTGTTPPNGILQTAQKKKKKKDFSPRYLRANTNPLPYCVNCKKVYKKTKNFNTISCNLVCVALHAT